MAPNSSKTLPALMPSKAKNGTALVNEKIDERILRMIGLDDVFDIDYDTYSSLLRERMAAARMTKQRVATEEVELITNEWKRIKGKKGRFKVKKITAASFKKGTAVGINLKKQKVLPGIKQLALPPATEKMTGKSDIQEIIGLLGEIIKSLTQQNTNQKKANEKSRKEAEDAKRALQESKLESGFKAAIKVAEKILSPVKSLLKKIIDYFTAIFIGRSIFLLLEWFGNPENKRKLEVIGRFFGDNWPKLLALYLRFGTQFGKFVGGLSKLVIAGTLRLVQLAARLVGAKGVARFLGGRGGKLLGAGLQVAATVGTTMALSSGIENFGGIGGEEKEPKTPGFAGGGLAQLKKLFGFFGGSHGYVSGQKGVDKIPAMLSDGEFVMSRGAVQKYGVDTLESMNAAGGGTNRPRMISGTTYAAGGGLIGDGPIDSGVLKVGTTFGGAPGTGQTRWIGVDISGGSKATQGSASATLGYGSTYEPTAAEVAVQTALNNLTSSLDKLTSSSEPRIPYAAPPEVQKTKVKKGLTGSFVANLNSFYLGSPQAKPKVTTPEIEPQTGQQKSSTPSPSGQQVTPDVPPIPTEAETAAYRDAVSLTSTYGPGYYESRGASPAESEHAMKLRDADTTIRDYRAKYLEGGSRGLEKPSMMSDGSFSFGPPKFASGGLAGLNQTNNTAMNVIKLSSTRPKLSTPTPPPRPPVIVRSKPNNAGKAGAIKSTGGVPKAPVFGVTCPSPERTKKKKILGIF